MGGGVGEERGLKGEGGRMRTKICLRALELEVRVGIQGVDFDLMGLVAERPLGMDLTTAGLRQHNGQSESASFVLIPSGAIVVRTVIASLRVPQFSPCFLSNPC